MRAGRSGFLFIETVETKLPGYETQPSSAD